MYLTSLLACLAWAWTLGTRDCLLPHGYGSTKPVLPGTQSKASLVTKQVVTSRNQGGAGSHPHRMTLLARLPCHPYCLDNNTVLSPCLPSAHLPRSTENSNPYTTYLGTLHDTTYTTSFLPHVASHLLRPWVSVGSLLWTCSDVTAEVSLCRINAIFNGFAQTDSCIALVAREQRQRSPRPQRRCPDLVLVRE
ncbi:hypothetical protein LX32DRAFT_33986 [Colletotrichum zoysiae]|uniref:Secreted protein n=1 Tax=Colletotrichum zoysiae TaxID=1216348 RepID=A0AAD9HBS5_9PEZI|nr:hypothetical protein LX32DRAFT_33986 [Colletotrichum zoysiae]